MLLGPLDGAKFLTVPDKQTMTIRQPLGRPGWALVYSRLPGEDRMAFAGYAEDLQ